MGVQKPAKLLIPLILLIALGSASGRESADLAPPPGPAIRRVRKRRAAAGDQGIHLRPDLPPARAIAIAERRGAGAKVVDLGSDGSIPHPA